MANPFKEAEKFNKVIPNPKTEKSAVDPVPKKEETRPQSEPVAEVAPNAAVAAILQKVSKKKAKPEKKSASYYLTVSHMERLKKAAKKAGMSDSEFLDSILESFFGEE